MTKDEMLNKSATVFILSAILIGLYSGFFPTHALAQFFHSVTFSAIIMAITVMLFIGFTVSRKLRYSLWWWTFAIILLLMIFAVIYHFCK